MPREFQGKSELDILDSEQDWEAFSPTRHPTEPPTSYIDDQVVAEEAEIRTQTGYCTLCGDGLCVGYDGGDAVSSEYTPRFDWNGGRIIKVVCDVAEDAYVDVEKHLAAAMARD